MIPSANVCENCGTPMHHLQDFGTNLDGTVNTEFCRHCYRKGQFFDRGLTLEQKIGKNIAWAGKRAMPPKQVRPSAHPGLTTYKRRKAKKLV